MALLETQRCILREIDSGDAAFLLELLNSPEWIKYIGDRNVHTEAEAVAYMQRRIIPSYTEFGYSMYVVELKEDQQAIGLCGLVNREGLEGVDIGFGFLPSYHGKGYGYESSRAILDFAKNDLDLTRVVAITLPHNMASRALCEKLGMRFESLVRIPNDPDELCLYEIDFVSD